ncbi:hypothetical protein ACLOJK_031506 [Asimina triloba]
MPEAARSKLGRQNKEEDEVATTERLEAVMKEIGIVALKGSKARSPKKATKAHGNEYRGRKAFKRSYDVEARALKILKDLLPVDSRVIRENVTLSIESKINTKGRGFKGKPVSLRHDSKWRPNHCYGRKQKDELVKAMVIATASIEAQNDVMAEAEWAFKRVHSIQGAEATARKKVMALPEKLVIIGVERSKLEGQLNALREKAPSDLKAVEGKAKAFERRPARLEAELRCAPKAGAANTSKGESSRPISNDIRDLVLS